LEEVSIYLIKVQ